jgi:hypothetical protein
MNGQTEKLIPDAEVEVVSLATAILKGDLGMVEGVRKLVRLRSQVTKVEFDPDFLPLIGIDSETDVFPIGAVRQHWAPEALAEYDRERLIMEAHYRDLAFDACRQLLQRFPSATTGSIHLPTEGGH